MVNNLEVVKVLIQHKADVNAKDIVRLLMCHLYTSLNIIFFLYRLGKLLFILLVILR